MAVERLVPFDRIPPQSLDMEQATPGSDALRTRCHREAAEILRPEDFYREAPPCHLRGHPRPDAA